MLSKRNKDAVVTTVDNAVADTYSVIEELAGEMRDWHDNMPESFQNGDKGDEVSSCADTLEGIQCPDVPEKFASLTVTVDVPRLLARPSRGDRLEQALIYAYGAVSALDEYIEERDGIPDKQSDADEAGELREEIQGMIDEAEDVSFPAMR